MLKEATPGISAPRNSISALMRTVSNYIARAVKKPLPQSVTEAAKHHLLDTLAATISGSRLHPGKVTIAYLKTQGGTPQACIPGSRIVTTATNAAFGSGMLAHADETDDSHVASLTHPGCGVVPAALAMAERVGASGTALLRATALGYDICTRLPNSLGNYEFYKSGHCVHSFGNVFGAAAAAGALAGLKVEQVRHLLSYTAHSASGLSCYGRDAEHIEKSYDHGAKAARDAVALTTMIEAGFTGVGDAFSGDKNFYFAFSQHARPDLLAQGLGEVYEVVNTGIKRWSTGAPTQAMLDSLSELIKMHHIKAANVEKMEIRSYDHAFRMVSNRSLPDVCMQHLAAIMLIDGGVTFTSSHDFKRMQDPDVLKLRRRIEFLSDAALEREYQRTSSRQAIVELRLRDGRVLRHHTTAVRGSLQNPMNRQDVDDKCFPLLASGLGKRRSRQLIDTVWNIEQVRNIRTLRPLLRA